MYYSKFFAIIFAAASSVTSVSANCFGSGPNKPDHQKANDVLDQVCSMLQGSYQPHEKRHFCTFASDTSKWDWTIKLITDKNRDLGKDECKSGLGKQLKCDLGGTTDYKNWHYTADANNGQCQKITGYDDQGS